MKHLFWFFKLLFFYTSLYSQDHNIFVDTTFFQNGDVESYGIKKDSLKMGVWHYYFANKTSKDEITYFKGFVLLIKKYDRGILFELCLDKSYFGAHSISCHTLQGEGCLKEFYYTEGKKDSKIYFFEFFDDFNIKSIRMVDARNHGDYFTFFRNGLISSEGFSLNGNQDGLWKYYYENGQYESIGHYQTIKLDSINIHQYGTFITGNHIPNVAVTIKIGKWYYYDNTGTLIKEEEYDEGILTKTTLY